MNYRSWSTSETSCGCKCGAFAQGTAHKTISRANAKRMIETLEERRRDRYDTVQAGSLSVYMEDVVHLFGEAAKR